MANILFLKDFDNIFKITMDTSNYSSMLVHIGDNNDISFN